MIFDSINDLATMDMIFRILAPIFNDANRRYAELRVAEASREVDKARQDTAETKRRLAEIEQKAHKTELELARLKWRNKRKDLLEVHAGIPKPRRGRKPRPKLARVV